MAACPANQYGTNPLNSTLLDNIHNSDWALYAGIEFGNLEYKKIADSIQITASGLIDGQVEIWLDSIGTGNKIGSCDIKATGSWNTFKTFSGKITPTTGRHDLYLKFTSSSTGKLFQIKWIQFLPITAHIVNSQTNLSGDSLTFQLDKKMQLQAPNFTEFQLFKNSGESISIHSVSFKSNDSTTFQIAINPRIYFEDTIRFSYSGSSVKSYDGYDLYSYSLLPVKNFSMGYPPILKSASAQLNDSLGSTITLKFDRQMADVSSQKVFFSAIINGLPFQIDTLIGNSDSVKLFVGSAINYGDTVKLNYSAGNVSSIHKGLLDYFTDYPVQNLISKPSGIKDFELNNKVVIYPVPLKNEVKVKSEIAINLVRIYNVEGKLVFERSFTDNSKIATLQLNLEKGLYIIKLSNTYSSAFSKIIIE